MKGPLSGFRKLVVAIRSAAEGVAPPTGYTVSSTSGTAPMMVHFSADFSGDATGFHYYDYTWDFDDPTSGTWGTTGKSRNAAKGPVTGHVFETAGTYAVTLTVRGFFGNVVASQTFNITVADPDVTFAGTDTVCVNPAGDTDFTGAPSGCVQLSTDDMSVVTPYAVAGTRILFKRGASWTLSAAPSWPNNAGPVQIGAYGSGTQDASGRYTNAPEFTLETADIAFLYLSNKKNWVVKDLSFIGGDLGSAVKGTTDFQDILLYRLVAKGFRVAFEWFHFNTGGERAIQRISMVDSFASQSGVNIAFAGAEYLAFIGNEFLDAQTSHILRVWQSYKGIISNNKLSGASSAATSNRHALKLHGPSDDEINNFELRQRTQFAVVSDNILGASPPWPIMIAPQNSVKVERLSHIIFERNKYIAQFATPGVRFDGVRIGVTLAASDSTVRNNIIDASYSGNDLEGIKVSVYPSVDTSGRRNKIYNNTIYKFDENTRNQRYGISVEPGAEYTIVKNNLFVSSLVGLGPAAVVNDNGTNTDASNNIILFSNTELVDPDNVDPLARDYSLLPTATNCIDQGTTVESVYEDFDGNSRALALPFDIGAFEFAETYSLFKPSGEDSLITFDGDTFKVRD